MNILYIDRNTFCRDDIKEAFKEEGYQVTDIPFCALDSPEGKEFIKDLHKVIEEGKWDDVFSFHFYPEISNVCEELGVHYTAWLFDNPYILLYHPAIMNKCNTVYVFDSDIYEEFSSNGINTVRYLPMAANTKRLDKIASECSKKYDVSFVGALYHEEHDFYGRMDGLSDYAKGYLEGIINSQLLIQGYDVASKCLAPVYDELKRALYVDYSNELAAPKDYFYSQYMLNRKITSIERTRIVREVGERFGIDLFTHDLSFKSKGVNNHGVAGYYDDMPKVFASSKINLNISLRSIHNGIPLRCFDIMGCGGFLLSNYQSDFLKHFTPEKDFVYYEDESDLIKKIDYYLSHDEEREEIAASGHEKISAGHSFVHRVREMYDGIQR